MHDWFRFVAKFQRNQISCLKTTHVTFVCHFFEMFSNCQPEINELFTQLSLYAQTDSTFEFSNGINRFEMCRYFDITVKSKCKPKQPIRMCDASLCVAILRVCVWVKIKMWVRVCFVFGAVSTLAWSHMHIHVNMLHSHYIFFFVLLPLSFNPTYCFLKQSQRNTFNEYNLLPLMLQLFLI